MPPSPVEIVFVAANDQMPGVAPGPGAAAVPRGAVRVRAVLDQDDPLGAAELGDPLDVERDVAADVDEEHRARPVRARPSARSRRTTCRGRRGCSRRTRPRPPAASAASGVAMNVFDGQSTVCPRTLEELERGERGSRPARGRDRRQPVPGRPRVLERLDERPVRPALRVEDAVPERVQPLAVAVVEADREGAEARGAERAASPTTSARRLRDRRNRARRSVIHRQATRLRRPATSVQTWHGIG